MNSFLKVKTLILKNIAIICNELDKLKHAIAERIGELLQQRRGYYNKIAYCINCKRKIIEINIMCLMYMVLYMVLYRELII